MYDWANSAFATSGVAAVFPVYFVFLFKEAIGETGSFLGITFTGSSMWSLAVVISTATVALSSPVLGVISDRVPIKKALLWTYASAGALFTGLVFFSAYTAEPWAWLFGMFILANIGFTGSLVFYNSFLPHIGPRNLLDDISSRGFAFGYAGGGAILLAHLAVIITAQDSTIEDVVTRAVIASIGIWWFGWALWTLRVVPEPPILRPVSGLTPVSALSMGVRELGRTFRELARFRVVLVYLGSYLLFHDGLQTVIAIAGAFAADTLGISLAFNMATVVVIQFVAVPGALAFGWLARLFSTKSALTVALAGWTVIVLFGVALAPLTPTDHGDFDYQLSYHGDRGTYVVEAATDSEENLVWEGETWTLQKGLSLSPGSASSLLDAAGKAEGFEYGLSISGGALDGETAVGLAHPSALGSGPIDWWPTLVRDVLWKPLGIDAGFQWLILGFSVGLVIGGSQALARSLFAQITPVSRSGEFFSFFGFITRASSVFGPIIYIVATALFDTRVAVTAILLIIIAGAVLLQFVNVREGAQVAEIENRRYEEGETAEV